MTHGSALPSLRETDSWPNSAVDALRSALQEHGAAHVPQAWLDAPRLNILLQLVAQRQVSLEESAQLSSRAAPVASFATLAPFPLPLHRDGALVDMAPTLIAFSALDAGDDVGRLELLDSDQALKELSPSIRAALDTTRWEYRVADRRPFPHLPEGWFTRDTFIGSAVDPRLNIILPASQGAPSLPWETRMAGMSPEASDAFIAELDGALRTTKAFTSHQWAAGDLVVIDNARFLHGVTHAPRGSRHHTVRASI